MKIKEVKELPTDKKEEDKKEVKKVDSSEEEDDSEALALVENDSEEVFIDKVEQFREEFFVDFFPEALLLSSALEEKVWQSKNLEESLRELPGKIDEQTSRGSDFYKAASPGDFYGGSSSSNLYNGGGANLYNGAGEDERILYSPFGKAEDDELREFGQRDISRLEIEGVNRRFGAVRLGRRDQDKNKYAA